MATDDFFRSRQDQMIDLRHPEATPGNSVGTSQLDRPFVGLVSDPKVDEIFDGNEMIKIFEGSDRRFKTRVFNLEVEDFHTYCIGDLGVWVHGLKPPRVFCPPLPV
ncbi:MAG: HINT domain-containing protein [Zoogloeaceae bacterium]|jgi:hypothetical protein|nr:HINT domain-containing protein [Zoogloeaceae bacterium]